LPGSSRQSREDHAGAGVRLASIWPTLQMPGKSSARSQRPVSRARNAQREALSEGECSRGASGRPATKRKGDCDGFTVLTDLHGLDGVPRRSGVKRRCRSAIHSSPIESVGWPEQEPLGTCGCREHRTRCTNRMYGRSPIASTRGVRPRFTARLVSPRRPVTRFAAPGNGRAPTGPGASSAVDHMSEAISGSVTSSGTNRAPQGTETRRAPPRASGDSRSGVRRSAHPGSRRPAAGLSPAALPDHDRNG